MECLKEDLGQSPNQQFMNSLLKFLSRPSVSNAIQKIKQREQNLPDNLLTKEEWIEFGFHLQNYFANYTRIYSKLDFGWGIGPNGNFLCTYFGHWGDGLQAFRTQSQYNYSRCTRVDFQRDQDQQTEVDVNYLLYYKFGKDKTNPSERGPCLSFACIAESNSARYLTFSSIKEYEEICNGFDQQSKYLKNLWCLCFSCSYCHKSHLSVVEECGYNEISQHGYEKNIAIPITIGHFIVETQSLKFKSVSSKDNFDLICSAILKYYFKDATKFQFKIRYNKLVYWANAQSKTLAEYHDHIRQIIQEALDFDGSNYGPCHKVALEKAVNYPNEPLDQRISPS